MKVVAKRPSCGLSFLLLCVGGQHHLWSAPRLVTGLRARGDGLGARISRSDTQSFPGEEAVESPSSPSSQVHSPRRPLLSSSLAGSDNKRGGVLKPRHDQQQDPILQKSGAVHHSATSLSQDVEGDAVLPGRGRVHSTEATTSTEVDSSAVESEADANMTRNAEDVEESDSRGSAAAAVVVGYRQDAGAMGPPQNARGASAARTLPQEPGTVAARPKPAGGRRLLTPQEQQQIARSRFGKFVMDTCRMALCFTFVMTALPCLENAAHAAIFGDSTFSSTSTLSGGSTSTTFTTPRSVLAGEDDDVDEQDTFPTSCSTTMSSLAGSLLDSNVRQFANTPIPILMYASANSNYVGDRVSSSGMCVPWPAYCSCYSHTSDTSSTLSMPMLPRQPVFRPLLSPKIVDEDKDRAQEGDAEGKDDTCSTGSSQEKTMNFSSFLADRGLRLATDREIEALRACCQGITASSLKKGSTKHDDESEREPENGQEPSRTLKMSHEKSTMSMEGEQIARPSSTTNKKSEQEQQQFMNDAEYEGVEPTDLCGELVSTVCVTTLCAGGGWVVKDWERCLAHALNLGLTRSQTAALASFGVLGSM
ncbi:unnamed protein product [Amoebophrya sp. A25]|nr:unnamed protein product [Amoebophrya sp. A25]|eukprot:GSA25T00004286001.1